MGGGGQHHAARQGQPPASPKERHHRLVRAIDALADPHHPGRQARAPMGVEPSDHVPRHPAHRTGKQDRQQHHEADRHEPPETHAKEVVEREGLPQHAVPLEGLPGPQPDRQRPGDGEEEDGRHEAHERGDHGLRNGDAEPLERIDRHGGAAGLRGREEAAPRVQSGRQDAPAEGRRRPHVPDQHVQPQPAAEPVERRERHADRHPPPLQVDHRLHEQLEVVAVEQDAAEPQDGDDREDLETAAQDAGGERSVHGRAPSYGALDRPVNVALVATRIGRLCFSP